jgi:hypothetical protein
VLNEKQRPCRDGRYKFDRIATDVWAKAEADTASSGFKLIQFLRKCRVDNPNDLSEGEFNQLAALYADEDTRRQCDVLAGKGDADATQIPAALKALFASGFPWIEKQEVAETPDRFVIPVGRSRIREWILTESEILQPNVRRRVTEDIESIVEVVEWAAQKHGRAVFDDFRQRMRNESTLLWNDVREGRIVNALKRKWGFHDSDSSTGAGGDKEDK